MLLRSSCILHQVHQAVQPFLIMEALCREDHYPAHAHPPPIRRCFYDMGVHVGFSPAGHDDHRFLLVAKQQCEGLDLDQFPPDMEGGLY